MAHAKMETAAEKYRRIKAERLAQSELTEFTSPSGMVWQLRKPDLALFITSGMMPMSFAAKLAEVGGDESAFTKLDFKDQAKTIEFSAKVVRYCAVSPRIVENPTPGADEIGYDEVEQDDFLEIFKWAMPTGGAAAEGLNTFPGE